MSGSGTRSKIQDMYVERIFELFEKHHPKQYSKDYIRIILQQNSSKEQELYEQFCAKFNEPPLPSISLKNNKAKKPKTEAKPKANTNTPTISQSKSGKNSKTANVASSNPNPNTQKSKNKNKKIKKAKKKGKKRKKGSSKKNSADMFRKELQTIKNSNSNSNSNSSNMFENENESEILAQDFQIRVIARFRPTNAKEKAHEERLMFLTDFDMDNSDFDRFMSARQRLIDGNLDLKNWTIIQICEWLESELEFESGVIGRFRRRKVNGEWLLHFPAFEEKKPLEIDNNCVVAFNQKDQSHSYEMDLVLDADQTQTDCFGQIGPGIVSDIIAGFNYTIFAYGQTGTGKTHSMFGSKFASPLLTSLNIINKNNQINENINNEHDINETKNDINQNQTAAEVETDTETNENDNDNDNKTENETETENENKDDADAEEDVAVEVNTPVMNIDEFFKSRTKPAKSENANANANVISTDEHDGIIPRTMDLLFHCLRTDQQVSFSTVSAAFIEIYQEKIRDLLRPKMKLTLRYVGLGSAVVNLSWHDANNTSQILRLIDTAKKNRVTAETAQNETSSRSHCIIQVKVEITLRNGKKQVSFLNFGDLAGSEKITKTQAVGARLREAKKIVQSLFALKKTIRALSEKKAFVPYQESVLTKLLRDSLGGNCKTSILVNVSPHAYNRDESLSTLRFAEMARKISNEASVNRLLSRSDMETHINELREKLQYLRKKAGSRHSRWSSTDFRVLQSQLMNATKKSEEYQSRFLQSEIQLLIKTQYCTELENIIQEKENIIDELQQQLQIKSDTDTDSNSDFSD